MSIEPNPLPFDPGISLVLGRIGLLNLNLNMVNQRVNNITNLAQTIRTTNQVVRRDVHQIQRFDDPRILNFLERILALLQEELPNLLAETTVIKRNLTTVSTNLTQRINQSGARVARLLNESEARLLESIESEGRALSARITALEEVLLRDLKALSDVLLSRIALLGEDLFVLLGELQAPSVSIESSLLAQSEYLTLALGGLSASLITLEGTCVGIEASILVNRAKFYREGFLTRAQISKEHKSTRSTLLTKLSSLEETLLSKIKKLDEAVEELPSLVGAEVCLQIVGESYAKWDSVSTYYPTLIFVFREDGISQYPRRAQIKVRLKEKTEEVTDQTITTLISKIGAISNLSFLYDTTRANYVSADRRFKTTIFVTARSEAEQVLIAICGIIGEAFDPHYLSITEDRKRLPFGRRSTPLGDVDLNPVTYQTTLKVSLFKVALLVNGLSKPVLVYPVK